MVDVRFSDHSKAIISTIKKFGRPPSNPVFVNLDYIPDVDLMAKQVLKTLTHFEQIDFKDEAKLMEVLYRGVLFKTSSEYKMFQTNLQRVIKQNLEETGYDPVNSRPKETYAKYKRAKSLKEINLDAPHH
jgi:hypothetical protein